MGGGLISLHNKQQYAGGYCMYKGIRSVCPLYRMHIMHLLAVSQQNG